MKANRRPPETGDRQSQVGEKTRLHIVLPKKWMRLIERAARQQNIGRSNFIARAAHQAAADMLAKDEVTND